MASPITNALSKDKDSLAKANKQFPSSMARKAGVNPVKSAATKAFSSATPSSNAGPSYNPIKTAKDVVGGFKNPEGPSTAAGLGSVAANVKAYQSSIPKMHKGGVVSKDGAYQMKAGETVRTPKQEKTMQEHIKKASSAAQVMTKDEPKKESKPAEKKEHKSSDKKKKHAHKVEVEKKMGGYLVKTHHKSEPGDMSENKPEESVHPDLNSVNQHINDAMGPDEAPAGAPPQGAGAPPAAAAAPPAAAPMATQGA